MVSLPSSRTVTETEVLVLALTGSPGSLQVGAFSALDQLDDLVQASPGCSLLSMALGPLSVQGWHSADDKWLQYKHPSCPPSAEDPEVCATRLQAVPCGMQAIKKSVSTLPFSASPLPFFFSISPLPHFTVSTYTLMRSFKGTQPKSVDSRKENLRTRLKNWITVWST